MSDVIVGVRSFSVASDFTVETECIRSPFGRVDAAPETTGDVGTDKR